MSRTIEQLLQDLGQLRAAGGEDVKGERATIESQLADHGYVPRPQVGGSRFAGPGASPDVVKHLASGGSIGPEGQFRTAPTLDGHGGNIAVGGVKAGGGGLSGIMSKALAEGTGSAGGYLVERQVAAEIAQLVRARSAVMKMTPRIILVGKEMAFTSLSSGAMASYTPENSPIPISEETFAQEVLLRPVELAALVPISNRLLRDAASNPSAEQVIRTDLAEVLALRQDLAFLSGDPVNGEPRGVRNHSGLTAAPSLGANGRAPSFDDLMDVVASLRTANAPFANPGWLFNPRTINTLQKVKDTTGRYLADAGLLTFDRSGGSGTLLGFKFQTSGQIPTNMTRGTSNDASYIVFGSDWDEALVGENEGLTIDASGDATYNNGTTLVSAFQNRQVLFRAVAIHDFALRRPQFFSVMEGVRP